MQYRLDRWMSLLLGALLVGGCGLFSLDEQSGQLAQLIQNNKEAWEATGIESYRFTYNKTVGGAQTDSVRVTVREGQIDTVTVEGNAVDDPDAYLTVDGLYDEIIRNFEREDRGRFRVQFNEEFSYPKRYRMAAGDGTQGRGVVVTSFSLLNGTGASGEQRRRPGGE